MSIDHGLAADGAQYFDEAYFERGWERGTAYVNYRDNAASSLIFKGVAEALAAVFRPTRALEIGCATGAIVRGMNFQGVPTYGIDVSDWAVKNALHANVSLASAEELPFPPDSFDLVYSSHSLEHLPQDIFMAAFREIDRVCSLDAVQFHMLPIVGTYPYDYDETTAIQNLKSDPTHVLLERMEWWLQRWHDLGWVPVTGKLFFPQDTNNAELSSGQFCLVRQDSNIRPKVAQAISSWNEKVFRTMYLERQNSLSRTSQTIHQISASPNLLPPPIGPAENKWDDLKVEFSTEYDLRESNFCGVIYLSGHSIVNLRLALIGKSGCVLEKWLEVPPGYSTISLEAEEFRALAGSGDLSSIRSIYFGGTLEDFSVSANFAIEGPHVRLHGIFA